MVCESADQQVLARCRRRPFGSRPVVGERGRASVVPGAVGVGGDARPRTEVRIAGVDLNFLELRLDVIHGALEESQLCVPKNL